MTIDSYLWLILLSYVTVVCINGGTSELFFEKNLKN